MLPGWRIAEAERASTGEWVQTVLLGTNLIWTTLCLGGYRPESMLVTLGLTATLLAVHFAICAFEKRSLAATHFASWCAIPFLAYALINVTLLTPVAWRGWMDWLGWANMFVVFWVLLNGIPSRAPRRVMFLILISLGLIETLLGAYQRFVQPSWLMLGRIQVEQFFGRASGSFGIPNSMAGFLLLLLPATAALAFRREARATERVWWGWVTSVLGLGLLLTVSRGGWISLALALMIWPLTTRQLKRKRRARAGLVVLGVLVFTGVLLYQTSPGVQERFGQLVRHSGESSRPILWRAAWEIFAAHPVTGSGAGSYNVVFEQHRPARFLDEPQWAHNDYLNTLSDYGMTGLVLLLGGALVGVIRQRKMDSERPVEANNMVNSLALREGLTIGIVAFCLQLFVDFHFKIPALAMAFAVVAALVFRPNPRSSTMRAAHSRGTTVGWLLAAAGTVVATFPMVSFYRGEALRYRARQDLDRYTTRPKADWPAWFERVEKDLRHATRFAPRHAGVWADLAHALAMQTFADPSRVAELADPAAAAAIRATELAPSVPEFWIRLGVARDMQAQREEARKSFENALKLAPNNPHTWYYYACHLSLATEQREAALRAIAKCLSLDPGNAAAEKLRVKL